MNTTQQSLHFGVPAVAIPLAHDQPAIASRLKRTGAGIAIPPAKLTASRLRTAVESVLPRTAHSERMPRRLQKAIEKAGGVEKAADIAENLIKPWNSSG